MTFRPSKRPPILRKFYNQKHKIVEVPLTRRFGGEIFQLEETGARLQMRWRREALRTSNKGIQTRIVRIGVGVPAYALWIRK